MHASDYMGEAHEELASTSSSTPEEVDLNRHFHCRLRQSAQRAMEASYYATHPKSLMGQTIVLLADDCELESKGLEYKWFEVERAEDGL